jgi:2-amino-4-hydroxy-6-hydroxymethyldihydropteridine diphosphokinase
MPPALQASEAILSLGSNQGDRLGWLRQACAALGALPNTRLTAQSPVYESDPVDVPDCFAELAFLNCVVVVTTLLAPDALSQAIHLIERDLGRTRGGTPNRPRTIDIDIVAIGQLVTRSPDLTLPHPRAQSRRFVLQPLADLLPDFRFPGEARSVSALLKDLPAVPRVTRFA